MSRIGDSLVMVLYTRTYTLEHVRFVELSKCNTFLLFIMCE